MHSDTYILRGRFHCFDHYLDCLHLIFSYCDFLWRNDEEARIDIDYASIRHFRVESISNQCQSEGLCCLGWHRLSLTYTKVQMLTCLTNCTHNVYTVHFNFSRCLCWTLSEPHVWIWAEGWGREARMSQTEHVEPAVPELWKNTDVFGNLWLHSRKRKSSELLLRKCNSPNCEWQVPGATGMSPNICGTWSYWYMFWHIQIHGNKLWVFTSR